MESILVTGGAGFIGSHLVDELLSRGYTVICVDDLSSGRIDNIRNAFLSTNFHFFHRTVCDNDLLPELKERFPGLNTVFHLAAISNVIYSVHHIDETFAVNYRATLALLAQAERLGFQSFIFAGSASEYGDVVRAGGVIEKDAKSSLQQLSPYGKSKYLASTAVSSSHIGVSLRFFNIYGPRQRSDSAYAAVVPIFMDMAIRDMPITIFGDGTQTRDFMYVDDAVSAYLFAHRHRLKGVYNVAMGNSVSILYLADCVEYVVSHPISRIFQAQRTSEIKHSGANIDLFLKDVNWAPAISLIDGLKKMYHKFIC